MTATQTQLRACPWARVTTPAVIAIVTAQPAVSTVVMIHAARLRRRRLTDSTRASAAPVKPGLSRKAVTYSPDVAARTRLRKGATTPVTRSAAATSRRYQTAKAAPGARSGRSTRGSSRSSRDGGRSTIVGRAGGFFCSDTGVGAPATASITAVLAATIRRWKRFSRRSARAIRRGRAV